MRRSAPGRFFGRSPRRVIGGLLLLGMLAAAPVHAQLEVLLRGLAPAPPKPGACGRYRFTAAEPTGPRQVTFTACVEKILPGAGKSVFLRLTSGDSLDARVELDPQMFAGKGGTLLDYVRSVTQITPTDTTQLSRDDWATLPGFDSAPQLPDAKTESLGEREMTIGGRKIRGTGRRIHEVNSQVKPLGGVQMTQKAERDIESWTAPEAPLLGLVRATATLKSERKLSAPVPGVPEQGERTWHYELELLDWGKGTR